MATHETTPATKFRVICSENPGVYGGDKHLAIIEDGPHGQIVADVESYAGNLAGLFAAAPELLEACERLLFAATADCEDPDAYRYAAAVVARAKGEAA
jgi:hypothetical protein